MAKKTYARPRYDSPFAGQSPLLKNTPLKKTSFDIWEILPEEDKARIRARKTLIRDYQETYENSLNYWAEHRYSDQNGSQTFDLGDDYNYFLTLFTSRDAELLASINRIVTPLDYEIILLLEDNSRDVNTAPSYYVKTGDSVRANIATTPGFINLQNILDLAVQNGIPKDQLSKETLAKLIVTSMESGSGHFKEKGINEHILNFLSPVFSSIADISEGIQIAVGYVIEGLGYLKINSDGWNYALGDPDMDLFFFPGYSNRKVSEEEIRQRIEYMKKMLKEQLRNQRSGLMQFSLIGTIPDPSAIVADGVVQEFFDNSIEESFRKFNDFIGNLDDLMSGLIEAGVVFINAFLCGLWNSFISLLQGILFLFQLFFMATSGVSDLMSNAEKMDHFRQLVEDFDYGALASNIWEVITEGLKYLIDNRELLLSKLRLAHVGYFCGALVEFILELLAATIIPGVGAVFVTLNKVGKFLGELAGIIKAIFKAAYKVGGDGPLDLRKIGVEILRVGKNKFEKVFSDIRKAILNWFKNLPYLMSGISMETLEILAKHGIRVETMPRPMPKIFASGIPIKTGEDLFILIKDGKSIPGLKSHILREVADKIKNMSEPDVKKYLDDLAKLLSGRISERAKRELIEMVDIAWEQIKKLPRRKRKGAVCVLEHPKYGIFKGISVKGLPREVFPEGLHPKLLNWLENRLLKMKKGDVRYLGQHGKCAEVVAFSELLWKIDPLGTKSLEDITRELLGTTSKSLRLSLDKAEHGRHLDACDSCNPMLGDFGMLEDFTKI